jgi:hypothetical protein
MIKEFSPEFIAALKAIDEAWPYKRLTVPQEMLDRYNKEFSREGHELTSMAITVDKNATFTEEEFWDLIIEARNATKNAKPLDFKDLVGPKW